VENIHAIQGYSEMIKTQFIIHCWLDVEKILGVSKKSFAIKLRSGAWTKRRIRIFKNYTLRSLLNQSFDDFRIFLFCGSRFRTISEGFDLGSDRVEKIYDYGRDVYQKIEADHVSIMRIDSDDLFHRNMMEEIRKLVLADDRKVFSSRKVIQWNILQNFMSDFILPVSPFTNHVLPKAIYKDFGLLQKHQFGGYRSAPELLPKHHVCIIRHRANVTWGRIGKDPGSERYRREEMAKRNNIILGRSAIIKRLKPFGIPADYIPKRGNK